MRLIARGSFDDVGIRDGYWWSASESSAGKAYSQIVHTEGVRRGYNNGSHLLSIRCVKD